MRHLNKDWILTQDALQKLLAYFDSDSERAAERYELVRAELQRMFRYRGCASPDDLADEVINRIARKIMEGEEIRRDELSNYFYGVARNVLREYQRSPASSSMPIDALPPSQHPAEDPGATMEFADSLDQSERAFECLESCLAKFPSGTRDLIVSYYEGEERVKIDNRRELAEGMGISVNSLRIRLHRIRGKLETCVSRCLEERAEH